MSERYWMKYWKLNRLSNFKMFQNVKIKYGPFLIGLQIEAMYGMVCNRSHLSAASHWGYKDFAKIICEFNSKLSNS